MPKHNPNLEKANRIISRQTSRNYARDYVKRCIAEVGSTVKEWNPYLLTDIVRKIAETKKYQQLGKNMLKILAELPEIDLSKLEKQN